MLSLKEIQKEFNITELLKSGPFSSVYRAEDNNGRKVAIKLLEEIPEKKKKSFLNFGFKKPKFKEGKILSLLKDITGVPRTFFSGKNPDMNSFMIVSELFDMDLNTFYEKKKMLNMKYISTIGVRLIEILESLHKKNIIHRDIKPENILLYKDDPEDVYLTDFGLSKIVSPKKKEKKNKKPEFVGNLKYASVTAHRGERLTKKDDMESLGYMLILFIQGSLPWDDLSSSDVNERIILIKDSKNKFLKEKLKTIPKQMSEYFEYIKLLDPQETINYDFLKNLLRDLKNPPPPKKTQNNTQNKKENKAEKQESEERLSNKGFFKNFSAFINFFLKGKEDIEDFEIYSNSNLCNKVKDLISLEKYFLFILINSIIF